MSICKKLIAGASLGCDSSLNKRYAQEVVVINKDDLTSIVKTISADTKYTHSVTFEMKASAKGFKFVMPANGSGVFGSVEKSTSDLGLVQYNHIANMLMFGVDETSKGILESFDKGRYVVAMKIGNVVEIYGIDNGLSTADYTLDIQGGAGASAIQLSSGEGFEESNLPLVYTAGVGGDPLADFDSAFAG